MEISEDLKIVSRVRIGHIIKAKPALAAILDDSRSEQLIVAIKNYSHLNARLPRLKDCGSLQDIQDVIKETGNAYDRSL